MAIKNFDIDVLGTSLSISVDEESDYLNEILKQYRAAVKNTKEIFNLKEPLNAAVLTGFMLSEELYKLRKQAESRLAINENEAREAEEVTRSIIARIDQVLEDSSSSRAVPEEES